MTLLILAVVVAVTAIVEAAMLADQNRHLRDRLDQVLPRDTGTGTPIGDRAAERWGQR